MNSIMHCLALVLLLYSQLCGIEANMMEFPDENSSSLTTEHKHELHIVYMGGVSETTTTNHENAHLGMLSQALGSLEGAYDSILYSYKKSFNGFAAVFSGHHAEIIRGMDGVGSVFKSQTKRHHTTASWEFLGLDPAQGIWAQSDFGNGTIIGVVDSGIWPESMSFNDDGFGPIPSTWNGSCVKAEQFSPSNCNNRRNFRLTRRFECSSGFVPKAHCLKLSSIRHYRKLIGAKYFPKGYESENGNITAPEYLSPRDFIGHGTHTSSTAAGARLGNASFKGVANGTATGGAPAARIAVYKACFHGSCSEADLLAANDEAIADGVDVLSISAGGGTVDYKIDGIAIGTFHAVEKGILVSCSAGNNGPSIGTAANTAPWIFTVAASSIHRHFESDLELRSDEGEAPPALVIVPGTAINTYDMNYSAYPIVYGGAIPAGNQSSSDAASCILGALDPRKGKGNIIVCWNDGNVESDIQGVHQVGAMGFVTITDADQSIQHYFTNLSNTNVDSESGGAILMFINNTNSNAKATIGKTVTVFNTTPAPVIAQFSSVGPNMVTADMLKPDITAPGVNILAAWPAASSSSTWIPGDTGHNFNFQSGTSMSCPHVSGIAALVKSVHPDWTPSVIKSAIMTTATPLNTSIVGNYELASGSGQVNPTKAADPGLVFDMTITDYVNFLCAIGYNSTDVQLVTQGKHFCPDNPTTVLDMNYLSIYISSNLTIGLVYNIKRTVTNVGPTAGPTKYSVTVDVPMLVPYVDVMVTPSSLDFNDVNEEQSFTVSVTIKRNITTYVFGSITWNDDLSIHSVRMPIGVGLTS